VNPGERAPLKLLMRGFGVRVPGGAPVFALARRHAALMPRWSGKGRVPTTDPLFSS
jgi:hypothetical protein